MSTSTTSPSLSRIFSLKTLMLSQLRGHLPPS
jgi:hypothetical protein